MGGYPYDDEVGAMVQPQQPGGWTDLLNDPIKRSALMSFGLQAMTGGWGNGTQQLAQALGAGQTGAAGTAASLQQQGEVERTRSLEQQRLGQTASEGEKNRKSHEKIAETGAASRELVAEIRGRNSIERANIALQKAAPSVAVKYLSEARKIVENNLGNLSMDDATKTNLIRQKAAELYDSDAQRGLVPQGTGGGDVNSQNAPGTPASQKKGVQAPAEGNAPMASPGPTGSFDVGLFPPRAIFGSGAVLYNQLNKDPKTGPEFKQLIQTDEGKRKLISKFPILEEVFYPKPQGPVPYEN